MRVLTEPLVHFVLVGAVLFGGYSLLNRSIPSGSTTEPVRIGEGEVRWITETFTSQWRRAPTAEELNGLLAGFLEEDLFAREAKALGLDRDDSVVRRRLAQKLTFLVNDTLRVAAPSDDELRRFYAANAEHFQTGARVSFTQIFFNPEHRTDAQSDAEAALISVSTAGGSAVLPTGDPLLLEGDFIDVDQQSLSNLFGADFARAVFALAPGSWSQPIKSGFGVHLVRVTGVKPVEPRPFEEVRGKVLEDWRHRKETEMRAAYLAKLREKYGVLIEDRVRPLFVSAPVPTVMPQ
jgi:parvulin-like peptidyl-prolyl cis-trans isomerase-like protein